MTFDEFVLTGGMPLAKKAVYEYISRFVKGQLAGIPIPGFRKYLGPRDITLWDYLKGMATQPRSMFGKALAQTGPGTAAMAGLFAIPSLLSMSQMSPLERAKEWGGLIGGTLGWFLVPKMPFLVSLPMWYLWGKAGEIAGKTVGKVLGLKDVKDYYVAGNPL